MTQGEMGRSFFVIMRGKVDISVKFKKKDENGEETDEMEDVVVATRGAGDWLGEGIPSQQRATQRICHCKRQLLRCNS